MGSTDDWFQATGTSVDNSFGATGTGLTAFSNSFDKSTYDVGAVLVGEGYGVLGQAFLTNDSDWPLADSYSDNAGVMGASTEFTGVAGISSWGAGVYGHKSLIGQDQSSIPNGLSAGVVGTSTNWSGIIGWSTNWHGVEGITFNGEAAVLGVADQGRGVLGISGSGMLSGIEGRCGNSGPTIPHPVTVAGVTGTSNAQHGVIGTSNGGFGVCGFSTNAAGILGETNNPAAFAGVFNGKVAVNGTLSAAFKQAVVPFPDGTRRVLVCMESPEHWFEDFGIAKLKGGRTVVKLDADFAKVIKRDYRVFLTPEGDCRGLYVRRKSASFEVRELMGGRSSIAFCYRIVGRRKDVTGHKRFAKVDPLPSAAATTRTSRAPITPTAGTLRAFVASVESEARRRRPKVTKKRGTTRELPKYVKLRRRIAAARQAGMK